MSIKRFTTYRFGVQALVAFTLLLVLASCCNNSSLKI